MSGSSELFGAAHAMQEPCIRDTNLTKNGYFRKFSARRITVQEESQYRALQSQLQCYQCCK